MESRKITVIVSKTNTKKVIMSEAETLGQLKSDLRANDISTSDVGYFEGITRVELKDDSSMLPKDVNYKGNVTNELVIMLSPVKKISSGGSRQELMAEVRELGLQELVKETYGRNYTQVPSEDLIRLVEANRQNTVGEETANLGEDVDTTVVENKEVEDKQPVTEFVDTQLRECVRRLVSELKTDFELENTEYILEPITEEGLGKGINAVNNGIESSYSEEETNDMFDFIK